MNCVHALNRLQLERFGSNIEQYNPVPSYIVKRNDRGHEMKLEIDTDEYARFCVTFREMLQVRSHTASVAPWMAPLKDFHRRDLMVTFFSNHDNECRIAGVGIVSVKNEDN